MIRFWSVARVSTGKKIERTAQRGKNGVATQSNEDSTTLFHDQESFDFVRETRQFFPLK